MGLLTFFILSLFPPSSRRGERQDYSKTPAYTNELVTSFEERLGKEVSDESKEAENDDCEKRVCYFSLSFGEEN